ncbi:MAG TPA: DNA recombination protein RmuC [Actinomycetota bacterium]|nr:DNA recombination protein RmuC [Actinomycetota bacterium]
MDTALVLASLVGVLVGAWVYLRARLEAARPTGPTPEEVARAQALAEDLGALREEMRRLNERVVTDSTMLSSRLEGMDTRMTQTHSVNTDLAQNIFSTLGDVQRATATVANQAREFTALQDLLRAPKARGGIGEAMLEELLRQVLPPQAYATQYRFTSGVIVDAVVKAGGRLVCIDSKFPLANYRLMCEAETDPERKEAERALAADIDKHIRDISSRYIVPDEETFDFAVMYVPAEGVYAEVLRLHHRKRPLFETAMDARVIPMSPLTMFGYLQTILFGLKCLSIEERAEEILDFCGRLGQDIDRFASEYDTLGKHIGNARTKYEEGARRLDRFRDRLERVVDLADDGADERPSLEVVGE